MMNQPPMPAGGAQQQQMPSQEEIMMAGMIALGLIDPQSMGQPPGGAPAPAPAAPMPQDDPKARIAQQLMK